MFGKYFEKKIPNDINMKPIIGPPIFPKSDRSLCLRPLGVAEALASPDIRSLPGVAVAVTGVLLDVGGASQLPGGVIIASGS